MSGGRRVTAIGRSSISFERRFCRVVLTARIALYVLIGFLRSRGAWRSDVSRRTPRTRTGAREQVVWPGRRVGRRRSRRFQSSLQPGAVVLAGGIASARFVSVLVVVRESSARECPCERKWAVFRPLFL